MLPVGSLCRLGDDLGPVNAHGQALLEICHALVIQQTGDPARSQPMSVQALADLREQQAVSSACFDVFWLCAALAAALILQASLRRALTSARNDGR